MNPYTFEDFEDLYECPGYPEHDYETFDVDGDTVTYVCTRCDVETVEEIS